MSLVKVTPPGDGAWALVATPRATGTAVSRLTTANARGRRPVLIATSREATVAPAYITPRESQGRPRLRKPARHRARGGAWLRTDVFGRRGRRARSRRLVGTPDRPQDLR